MVPHFAYYDATCVTVAYGQPAVSEGHDLRKFRQSMPLFASRQFMTASAFTVFVFFAFAFARRRYCSNSWSVYWW